MILPDALAKNLQVVFVGTAPSATSKRLGVPYGNGHNRFWPTLIECGFLPPDFKREDWRQIPEFGIGITDVCKTQAGIDNKLTAFDPERLWRRVRTLKPRYIAFTSRRAAIEGTKGAFPQSSLCLGDMGLLIVGSRLWGLTSPSPRAAWAWDMEPWSELAANIGAPPPRNGGRKPRRQGSLGGRAL